MSFEYSPYVPPLIAATLVAIWAMFYMWPHRKKRGTPMLMLLAAGIFAWTLGYALEIAGADLATKVFWGKMQYLGIATLPLAWVFFTILYTIPSYRLTRQNAIWAILPGLVSLVTMLLVATTEQHGLIWKSYKVQQYAGFSALGIDHGPLFTAYWIYAMFMMLGGTGMLVRSLARARGAFRGQRMLLFFAALAPLSGSIIYVLLKSDLDLTPFGFAVSLAAFAWASFGFRLMDIAPIARDAVMDAMREGMIVLDARGNIVDINSAAARMIGVPAADAVGKDAQVVFQPWAHLVERFRDQIEATDELVVGRGEASRRFEVRISPLHDRQGQFVGRVILLRAMDEEGAQGPKPSQSTSTRVDTRPRRSGDEQAAEESIRNPILAALARFFYPPAKEDLPIPPNVNPAWHRIRERLFTMILRFAATARTLALLITALTAAKLTGTDVAFGVIIAFFWFLGLARNVQYTLRTGIFLATIYSLGIIELLNYGFSMQSAVFFATFVIVSAVLLTRRRVFFTFTIALVTLGIFAALIVAKIFVPFQKISIGTPFLQTPPLEVLGLLVFAVGMSVILIFLVTLLENLNSAWQKEAQSLNLLQQERDLLEQRVVERTRDLAQARDEAERTSSNLRKYFRAIEQSGSTIVITDTEGNIEYANPRFEQTTGYSVNEALGNNPRILKSGRQSREYYRQMWDTISSGQVWNGEFQNRRKDGSLYWEYATVAPVMDSSGAITNYVAIKEDVTDRKSTEDQLLRLSQAVEQSGNTVIVMDHNGLIEYVNPKFTEVTGYTAEEARGRSPIALMNGFGSTPDFSRDEWWQTVNRGQIWHGEFHNHRKDGSRFWESATIAPVHSRDGTIINFVEIKQDVSEQKILQDQLQKQNDYLSILHQVTLDLLNRRDLNDLLAVVVERSAVLLDAPYSELMLEEDGMLVVEAFTVNMPELKGDRVAREEARLSWQAYDTREPVILDDYATWEHRCEIYPLHLHATADFPVMAGDRCLGVLSLGRSQPGYHFTAEQTETGILFARLVALVLDNANLYDSAMKEIAERKRAESLLQESEARFRQIVENASDVIYRTDADGRFIYVNPSALRVLNFSSEEEMLGRHYLDITTPEFRTRLKRFYDHQYLSKTRTSYFEFPAVTVDGQIAWIGQNVQLIMDGDEVIGFQAVARDITPLRQAQEALALSRDQALDASRFKSQLLSRVSHELRTPLGGILGYAELLEYNAFGPLNESQHSAMRNIIESTHYLTGMVNDLLDEAQIESKSLSLFEEYFRPADLLEKIRTSMSVLADKKGLSFQVELDPSLPNELYGDFNRLQQVIINLGGNAIKFTEEGAVSVRLKRPSPASWSIEVHDSGVGIPPADQQNIFEPFRQVSNSITRKNRGSGLGLAITRQLVELMGGQVHLASEIGRGSLFTVTLPIKNAPGE